MIVIVARKAAAKIATPCLRHIPVPFFGQLPPSTGMSMCRNIKTLHNFEPPATAEEIHASSLQFVRKLSGFARPSKTNQLAFDRAVQDVSRAAAELLHALVTTAPSRDREVETAKARARSAERFRSHAGDPA